MKTAVRGLLLLFVLSACFAYAQQSVIQHIIIVVQENRTPDNLFQDQNLINAGADIVPITTGGKCGTVSVPLIPRPLHDCVNPNHNHDAGWIPAYHNGGMDGACNESYGTGCTGLPACPAGTGHQYCPQYAYAVNNSASPIQPYWDIAEKYGFANYMFQTNQGPSFPAHQFLLSGTSAPDSIQNPDYQYFAAENMVDGNMQNAGCAASSSQTVKLISPSKDESTVVYPCFEHPTLSDLLDQQGVSWRYYSDQAKSIWTAPNAISHICSNDSSNDGCGSGAIPNDWSSHVGPYLETQNHLAPFLQDLQSCDLAQVTWVVPDGRWSDHANENLGLGPDYVADIVNAVGGTGPPTNNCGFWNNTVVLITWDDWGGWYDHVVPPDCRSNGACTGYSNGTGAQYVYGFRVPLLVVSAYAKPHYISGTITNPINYDFGSILNFIEHTFLPPRTFIDPVYPYADQFVQLGINDLSDFFDCSLQACKHPFQPIGLAAIPQYCNTNIGGCGQTSCNAACFINYPGKPKDPDDE